jgi:hypothetical protein
MLCYLGDVICFWLLSDQLHPTSVDQEKQLICVEFSVETEDTSP